MLSIIRNIHEAESFDQVLPFLEKKLRALLQAERLTVYQKSRNGREIISKFKTGEEIKEIRLPLSPSSIAGYVALSHKPLRLDDVYDSEYLKSIHPRLTFDQSYDRKSGFRTRSMVVTPIHFKGTLLGVLQIINKIGGGIFLDQDFKHAQQLAVIIGQKFQYDMQATQSPFHYLIQKKLITQEKLEELNKKSSQEKVSVAYLLMKEEHLSPEDIGESLERYYQVPFFKYDPNVKLPSTLMKDIKSSYLKNNRWIPIGGDLDKASILIDDPNDPQRIMEIQKILNAQSYDIKVGFPEDILRYLGEDVESIPEKDENVKMDELISKLQDDGNLQGADEEIGDSISSANANEAAVVTLVNQLIVEATKQKASDIHIEPGKGKDLSKVRMRIDGSCIHKFDIPPSHIRAVIARIKIMSKLDIAERRKPQDGKIAVKYKNQTIELRVATIPTVNGESAVLRVLASGKPLPFDKLNLSTWNESEIKKLVEHPHGIFLVVGPTGSGKTTTLHAVLGYINTPDRKIWTAEDPVEITQDGLQQVQIQPKIGFTFAAALRSFLRADPDVILIGEMRDQETAHIGVEASLTGHLVFSTLHTNSAPETITRLLDLELDPMNFADALLGILAQRLMRTLCKCKEKYAPDDQEFKQICHAYGESYFPELKINPKELTLFKPKGCDICDKSGYKGRTGIHELLVATHEMKQQISKATDITKIRELAISQGMRTLIQDGTIKVIKGQTDFIQLRRVAVA
ncbi:MAG: GspE/PulE family protein [Desulfobacterales bacterium]|nr:GspE/PulE family protein [Desulfobacterales bacterium]